MKKVHPVRIPVYIKTEIKSDRKSYFGVIGNLSEKGVFVETDPTKTATPFLPGKKLALKFQASSRKAMNLNCEVIWLYTKKNPHGLTNSIGIEIISPPASYKRYFKTL
jgi:hypothetical protein